jgi:hypothetical protein
MLSSNIGKVEKAMRYANEPERVTFSAFRVTLEGDHRSHEVAYDAGEWACDCETFGQSGYCSHTMTMERVLRNMLLAPMPDVPQPAAPEAVAP